MANTNYENKSTSRTRINFPLGKSSGSISEFVAYSTDIDWNDIQSEILTSQFNEYFPDNKLTSLGIIKLLEYLYLHGGADHDIVPDSSNTTLSISNNIATVTIEDNVSFESIEWSTDKPRVISVTQDSNNPKTARITILDNSTDTDCQVICKINYTGGSYQTSKIFHVSAQAITYTVTFINGSTTLKVVTVNAGETVNNASLPANPSGVNYTYTFKHKNSTVATRTWSKQFTEWKTRDNIVFSTSTPINANTEYYAQFSSGWNDNSIPSKPTIENNEWYDWEGWTNGTTIIRTLPVTPTSNATYNAVFYDKIDSINIIPIDTDNYNENDDTISLSETSSNKAFTATAKLISVNGTETPTYDFKNKEIGWAASVTPAVRSEANISFSKTTSTSGETVTINCNNAAKGEYTITAASKDTSVNASDTLNINILGYTDLRFSNGTKISNVVIESSEEYQSNLVFEDEGVIVNDSSRYPELEFETASGKDYNSLISIRYEKSSRRIIYTVKPEAINGDSTTITIYDKNDSTNTNKQVTLYITIDITTPQPTTYYWYVGQTQPNSLDGLPTVSEYTSPFEYTNTSDARGYVYILLHNSKSISSVIGKVSGGSGTFRIIDDTTIPNYNIWRTAALGSGSTWIITIE